MSNESEKDYTEKVADALIKQLKQGVAPWQKPWCAGERFLPHNPKSGTTYQGANAVWLMALQQAKGYQDTRWLTFKQTSDMGAKIKQGKKGAAIQFWQWSENKTVVGPDGQEKRESVKLDRPRVMNFVVFNAEQISGLPEADQRDAAPEWERHKAADTIIVNSGASIQHQSGDRAFYSRKTDQITMPFQQQFGKQDGYYATLLHEIGHWTGHTDRLDRDVGNNPFGSEGYAREELRAEIASLMIGDALGIGHDPSQHAAYVGSWIKALEEDPREIFRAASDAGKIAKFVLGLEQHQHLGAAMTLPEQVKALGPVLSSQEYGRLIDKSLSGLNGAARVAGESYLTVHTAILLGQDIEDAAQTATVDQISMAWTQESIGQKTAVALLDHAKRSADWSGELARAMGLDDEAAQLATDYRKQMNDTDWNDASHVSKLIDHGAAIAGNEREQAELVSAVWQAITPPDQQAPAWFIPPEERTNPIAKQMTGGTPSLQLIEALALDAIPQGRGLKQVDSTEWWQKAIENTKAAKDPNAALAALGEKPASGTKLWVDHDGQRIAEVAPSAIFEELQQDQQAQQESQAVAQVKEQVSQQAGPPQAAAANTYIDVPFTEKDKAKGLGAKWDRKEKSWYVPKGQDLQPFVQWTGAAAASLPLFAPKQDTAEIKNSAQDEFANALKDAGFKLTGKPIMDGKTHRVPVDGDEGRERSGAYAGFLDGRPAGWFQDYRSGARETWKAQSVPSLTAAERASLATEAERNRGARQKSIEAQHDRAAGMAAAIWAAATPADANHPYLARKQVGGDGLRQATAGTIGAADAAFGADERGAPAHQLKKGDLIVPMLQDGQLRSLQFIGEDGRKGFLGGGQMIGTSFPIGEAKQGDPIIIAEGYATSKSINEATGFQVEVAFNASNLSAVAQKVRDQNPEAAIVIAGDDDRHLPLKTPPKPNIGQVKAEEAAKAVGGVAVLPTFDAGLDGVDWNDVAVKEGQDGLSRELKDGITREQRRDRQERLDDHEKPKGLAERTEDRLATMQDATNEFNINRELMSSALRPNQPGIQVEAPRNMALAESMQESPKQTQQQVRIIAR
jgi:putative DNA primase/helicase